MLSKEDVRDILIGEGLRKRIVRNQFRLVDGEWTTCSERFCLEIWSHWIESLPTGLKETRTIQGHTITCPKWIENTFDCDNHCMGTLYQAQLKNSLHSIEKNRPAGGTLFGMLFYNAEPTSTNPREGGHAINWFINKRNKLKFFEPAEGRIIKLSPTEVYSIWFGISA